MAGNDPPPDHLRCKRTDGRQWRCKRLAMEGKTLCDIHHTQGKHRANKEKVPDELKLERKVSKKRKIGASSRVSKLGKKKPEVAVAKRRRVSEVVDKVLRMMKLKKGDVHLDLIRGFLRRQMEKRREKEMEREAAVDDDDDDDEGVQEFQLPYGVMAVSQSPSEVVGGENGDALDVKVGVESSGLSLEEMSFRSKNLEPLPVGAMQVVPFVDIVKRKKMKKCHWCRESKNRCLVKCLTCRKRFFCTECIRERNFEKQDLKMKCPACHGTCSCMLCLKQQHRNNDYKDCYTSEKKLERIHLLHYIISILLPVLKQINRDQDIELESEAKITGKRQPEIQIPQTKLGVCTLLCCSRCKTSIVDYHRTCAKCSYNLCLRCCRELSRQGLYESFEQKSCKKRKFCAADDEQPLKQKGFSENSGVELCSPQNWEISADGSIPCPPKKNGGCGDGHLDLRSMFPFTWNGDLEVKAEEILCSYDFTESVDVSSSCSRCSDVDSRVGEVQPQRIGFCENYLYTPTLKDLRQEPLEHFQSHWGKGHPIIVRNMLRGTSGLCWDPVIMLCSYMESKSSGPCNEDRMKGVKSLDWCEVEISRKRIFMGSLEREAHAIVRRKALKFRAWLSSQLFQKQFPVHYNEILSSLPLKEYINPLCGLLNLGLKLPEELPKPELGPCIYFSYAGPEEISQAEFLTKLHYEAHDTVNILAYATDDPISPEQVGTVEDLLKKHKARDHHGHTCSNSGDPKGRSSLQSEDTGESGLQDVEEKKHSSNGINEPFNSTDPVKDQTISIGNGNMSEDSETDDDAPIHFSGCTDSPEDSEEYFRRSDIKSSCSSEDKQESTCGAQWDIFRRQDVPQLVEYLKRHSNELAPARSYSKLVHPILDQNFFLDAYHKLKLKEEYDIQPWSFEQCPGEAIFLPAGCPYQVRKIKSCVNVVLQFISPENVAQCIQLRDEIRILPQWHESKGTLLEVEKMALNGISAAVDDFTNLTKQVRKEVKTASRSKDPSPSETRLEMQNPMSREPCNSEQERQQTPKQVLVNSIQRANSV